MNTLYVIRWILKDNYVISTSTFWNPESVKEKILKNPEWDFTIVEANETHVIWGAR